MNLLPAKIRKLSKRRKIALGVLTLAAIYIVYSVVRVRSLLRNGAQVGQIAQVFTRNYFVGDSSKPTIIYLSLGDSTAAGWGAHDTTQTFTFKIAQSLARRGFRVHVVNVAVGGATLRDVIENQLPKLQTIRPQLVTISIGANDSTRGTNPNEYSNDLQTLQNALKNSTARQVLWANTPDMTQTPAPPMLLSKLFGVRAQRQNALLNIVVTNEKIAVINLHDDGKLVYANDNGLYTSDLFHPSAKGYTVWSKLFIEQLRTEKMVSEK